ncbi:MAG: AAA family ATPase [Ruthenibacterium lactatiformans]
MPVKIIELEAENIKRVKAVQIVPALNGLTIIGGDNNQGKTSVLDAIAWALGGDKYRPEAAQREGANTPPRLHVNLSNGLVVERRGKNSALTVSDPSGRKGGQQLLNEFVEQLALDLPRFMNMNDREKADTLLKIIGVGDRLAAFDREIRALYDRRTTIGQIAEQKKHFAEEQVEYHDAPDEPVSVSELIRSQQEILARNGENQRKRERAAQLAQHVKDLQERVDSLAAQLQQASEQCANAMKDLETAQKSAEDLQDESTAELEASIRDAEEINRKVRANLDKARAEDEARSYADQYKSLTVSIDAKRQERRALSTALTSLCRALRGRRHAHLSGKRWGDMSGSDQLRGNGHRAKLNPECGFVLLDKLEQMDLRTLTDFGSWLASEGLQAIATRVSTGGECQIIIEDGRVQGADITPAPQPRQWTKGAF